MTLHAVRALTFLLCATACDRQTDLVARMCHLCERAQVALVADNPGVWMFHCHVIDHMETGLMAAIEVA